MEETIMKIIRWSNGWSRGFELRTSSHHIFSVERVFTWCQTVHVGIGSVHISWRRY